MRTAFLGAAAAIFLSTSAMAATPAPSPVVMRDCKTYQQSGPEPQQKPGAMYLYIFAVMVDNGSRVQTTYGALAASSLEVACQSAMTSSVEHMPTDQQWSVAAAQVQLIDDDLLRQGLAH